jgi:hypothetical protein
LPQGKRVFAAQQALWSWPPQPGGGSVVPPAKRCNLRVLRAFGADAGKSPRTPSAWMKLLGRSLAHRQDVSFVWVSLGEQKWVTLGERRGTPCGEGARSVLRTRNGQYASPIVVNGVLTCRREQFIPVSIQIVPVRTSRYHTHAPGLTGSSKVLYRTLEIASIDSHVGSSAGTFWKCRALTPD